VSGQTKEAGRAAKGGIEWHIMSYSMPFSF